MVIPSTQNYIIMLMPLSRVIERELISFFVSSLIQLSKKKVIFRFLISLVHFELDNMLITIINCIFQGSKMFLLQMRIKKKIMTFNFLFSRDFCFNLAIIIPKFYSMVIGDFFFVSRLTIKFQNIKPNTKNIRF